MFIRNRIFSFLGSNSDYTYVDFQDFDFFFIANLIRKVLSQTYSIIMIK
jgi:hypothetical protein